MKSKSFLLLAVFASLSAWAIEQDNTTVSHEWVDLGLPSGTLWATMNIGASSPEECGDYFAWGETQPKDYYYWNTYQLCNGSINKLTKYCTNSSNGYNGFTDNVTELDPEDDAATANWGSDWRMPSLEQMQELMDYCTRLGTTINDVNGSLLTSNINGASLFLPGTGYRSEGTLNYSNYGHYWSRTLKPSYPWSAYHLFISSRYFDLYDDVYYRSFGLCVRAVYENAQTGIEEINASAKSGQRYNLMGQPVGNDYKGIVIENGKKILVK